MVKSFLSKVEALSSILKTPKKKKNKCKCSTHLRLHQQAVLCEVHWAKHLGRGTPKHQIL
jgi:hypothetical protein